MARPAGEAAFARPLATDFAIVAGVNAKTRPKRAIARKRSDRREVLDCRRIHRRPFRAGCATGRHSLCPRAPISFALRARADFKNGSLANIDAALRRQSNLVRSLPG